MTVNPLAVGLVIEAALIGLLVGHAALAAAIVLGALIVLSVVTVPR